MRLGFVAGAFCLFVSGVVVVGLGVQKPVVEVFKSSTCGCCNKWVKHLEDNGFLVEAANVTDLAQVKERAGVPGSLASCHTAIIDGYVVEGHVPVNDLKRLLEERPDVLGISVPGMPIGSPGMEGPNPQSYDVVAFTEDGSLSRFSSHRP